MFVNGHSVNVCWRFVSRNALKFVSLSERASRCSAVAAGEIGLFSKRTQPANSTPAKHSTTPNCGIKRADGRKQRGNFKREPSDRSVMRRNSARQETQRAQRGDDKLDRNGRQQQAHDACCDAHRDRIEPTCAVRGEMKNAVSDRSHYENRGAQEQLLREPFQPCGFVV